MDQREHAERLLAWVQANIDIDAFGLVLHQDILVWYSEMCIETGLMERSSIRLDVHSTCLRPMAPSRLLIITRSGKKARRRCYPIPIGGEASVSAPARVAA